MRAGRKVVDGAEVATTALLLGCKQVSGKGKAGNLRSYYRLEGEASESKAGVEQLAAEGEGEEEEKAAGNEGASSGSSEASEQGSESGGESEVDELAEADERWARMR